MHQHKQHKDMCIRSKCPYFHIKTKLGVNMHLIWQIKLCMQHIKYNKKNNKWGELCFGKIHNRFYVSNYIAMHAKITRDRMLITMSYEDHIPLLDARNDCAKHAKAWKKQTNNTPQPLKQHHQPSMPIERALFQQHALVMVEFFTALRKSDRLLIDLCQTHHLAVLSHCCQRRASKTQATP